MRERRQKPAPFFEKGGEGGEEKKRAVSERKGGSEVSVRVALGFFDWLAEPSGAWSGVRE